MSWSSVCSANTKMESLAGQWWDLDWHGQKVGWARVLRERRKGFWHHHEWPTWRVPQYKLSIFYTSWFKGL